MMERPRASRARLWFFALGAGACMLLLCLAHQAPGLLGVTAPADTPLPQTAPPLPTATPARAEAEGEPTLPPPANGQPVGPEPAIELTVVYDNRSADARLHTGWGFACWIEAGGTTLLFDTGADGPTLLGNLSALGYDPDEIDIVVLSHAHDDHTGGLADLLGLNDHLAVYLPAAFPEAFKAQVRERATLTEVAGPLQIADGVWSLGPMGASPVEQALAVESSRGLVVVTGCAHPGITAIVRAARDRAPVHLVLGGFHLGEKSASEIGTVITGLQQLGVEEIGPCHCTGDLALRMFAAAFGAGYKEVAAGTVLSFPR